MTLRRIRPDAIAWLWPWLLVSACATPAQEPARLPPQAGPIEYSFRYSPEPETTDITATLGVVAPGVSMRTNAPEGTFDGTAVHDLYAKSLLTDFDATLVAKGYGVTGTFAKLDDMTYGEKQRAALVLIPTVTLDVRFQDGAPVPYSTVRTQTGQHVGNFTLHRRTQYSAIPTQVSVNGYIELVLYEPLSEQKMWVKKIEVPFQSASATYYRADTQDYYFPTVGDALAGRARVVSTATETPARYDGRPNALAEVLQGAYLPQLTEFSRYFDPKEIEHVMGEAADARSRARF